MTSSPVWSWVDLMAAMRWPFALPFAVLLVLWVRTRGKTHSRWALMAAGGLGLLGLRAAAQALAQSAIGILYHAPAIWIAGLTALLLAIVTAEAAWVAARGVRRPGRSLWPVGAGMAVALLGSLGLELALGWTAFTPFGQVLAAKPGSHSEDFPNRPTVVYDINSHGFRGPEWADAKTPGSVRGVVIGDSFAFGSGLTWDETLGQAVHRELACRVPQVPVEMVNLGLSGNALASHVDVYQEALRRLHPDFVVFCITGANDLTDEDDQTFRRARTQPGLLFLGRWLLGEMGVMWLWHAREDAPPMPEVRAAMLHQLRAQVIPGTAEAPPILWHFYGHIDSDQAALHGERSVWVEPPPADPEYWLPWDGHPSARGNALSAVRLANAIQGLPQATQWGLHGDARANSGCQTDQR